MYKKCLRTKVLQPQCFVDEKINAGFDKFLFGTGARKIEKMLKLVPFVFSFETRIRKLREFIKNDKKNYDRDLFMLD